MKRIGAATLTGVLVLLAAATFSTLGGVALGHAPGFPYYQFGGYPDRPHQERAYFTQRTPTGAFRDRFVNGQKQWDAITSNFQFIIYRDDIPTYVQDNCRSNTRRNREQASLIDYSAIDGRGGSLADTQICTRKSDGRNEFFQTTVDNADEIYFGRGDAPGRSADLGSIVVHELGHAAGWVDHYDDGEPSSENRRICQDNNDQQTMCATLYVGTERLRTLQGHDKHTHAQVYGN